MKSEFWYYVAAGAINGTIAILIASLYLTLKHMDSDDDDL